MSVMSKNNTIVCMYIKYNYIKCTLCMYALTCSAFYVYVSHARSGVVLRNKFNCNMFGKFCLSTCHINHILNHC